MPVKKKRSGADKAQLAQRKIKSVSESFQHLKLLAYGANGKGKTRLGASGPRGVLIVDCNEKGSLGVRKFEDVDIFPLDVWSDIDLAYWFLHGGNHEYETVVVDTVTSLAALCMKFVLGDEASRDPTRDPAMPDKRHWGKVGELMKTQILQFRNLPMHVVFLAQERRGFTDDDDEAPEVFPDVSPGIRTILTASVDIIGRMYVREVVSKAKGEKKSSVEYRMQIGPSERYVTKDRSESGLPSTIRLSDGEDNLARLVDRIKKGAN
jgi:hypothetical protein